MSFEEIIPAPHLFYSPVDEKSGGPIHHHAVEYTGVPLSTNEDLTSRISHQSYLQQSKLGLISMTQGVLKSSLLIPKDPPKSE
jgi:hypothetical protein